MNFPCRISHWLEFTIAFSPEAWSGDEVAVGRKMIVKKKNKTKQQTLRGAVWGLSDSEIFLWYLKLRLHKNSTSALNHDSFPPSTPSLGQPFKL